MKIELKITKEFDVKFLKASVEVRYWNNAELNGKEVLENCDNFPCQNGDQWEPVIDVDSGIIINWDKGNKASIHFKICDAGIYSLLDLHFTEIVKIDGYVPKMMCPKESGYGDYIIMDIEEDGKISKWNVDFADFTEEEEE